jgi:hypothetical protein
VLRLYCFLFEALLSLAAVVLSAVILASPHATVSIGWLPWSGETLGGALAIFGIAGLLVLFLAMMGRARILLVLFSLVGLIGITRGLFFTTWRFHGAAEAEYGALFAAALTFAFIGSIPIAPRR